ncbi:MAG: HAD family hydrolase [Bacteroidetes bacterium]|nr:HAD family hydrolase [Bacteroidota bacterium]
MIKGLLFDYGGTIDTNGLHWGRVLWDSYEKHQAGVPEESFLKAYSYGERALAINPIIEPRHTFLDTLQLKIEQQFLFLRNEGIDLPASLGKAIALDCYQFAKSSVQQATPVLAQLAERYPLVMVSNFYGNLSTVLNDFGILEYFQTIVESAVVGVRKPDAAIYALGVQELGFTAHECVVIGDSYSKDIVPANSIGCKTIWLKVKGWGTDEVSSTADVEIDDFGRIPEVIVGL